MGGPGNSNWKPTSREKLVPIGEKPKKPEEDPFAPPPLTSPSKKERREKTEKEKKLEAWKKQKAQSPEAIKAREKKAAIKAMTSEQRVENYVNNKIWERHLKKEHLKWEKAGSRGGHQKGWLEGRMKELQQQWASGGREKWEKSNPKQAKAIREKARREETWRIRKK